MHVPPPPVQRKKSPVGPILLALGLCAAVIIGLCAVGGYFGFKMFSQKPGAKPGFGKPIAQKYLDNGWAVYRFPEIPMIMELPSQPVADSLLFEPGDGLYTQHWISYAWQSEINGIDFIGTWFRQARGIDEMDERDFVKEWLSAGYDATNIQVQSQESTFGQTSGILYKGSYMSSGEKILFQMFAWGSGKTAFNLVFTHYPNVETEAEQEIKRILKSIHQE